MPTECPPSVCHRLRTGHTLLRQEGKTQPLLSCSALHPFTHPSSSPSILSTGLHPPCRPFPAWDTAAHCALASSCSLPPHPPAHVLPPSTCTVSSPFYHLLSLSLLPSVSETATLFILIYFCPDKNARPPLVDPLSAENIPASSHLSSSPSHTSL